MCDSLVALPAVTRDNVTLFAKNSDRERTEEQRVESFPAADYDARARVTCTYLSIPQAHHTHAVLICRPFWMWGAEMGANEKGVVIGNEAVFARLPALEKEALLGMDLVRLSLERASTAAEALDVIVDLLERHGQGGNCGFRVQSFYHNSFLIADATEAYVLETVGREWVAERVNGCRAISNSYSVGRNPLRASEGLDALILRQAWPVEAVIDYADTIADRASDASGRRRGARSTALLARGSVGLSVADMISILRDHGPEAEQDISWRPQRSVNRTVCMHATDSEPRGQTVGSLVAELSGSAAVYWVTGTAAPCTSIFKPVLPGIALSHTAPTPRGELKAATFWQEHENLHRALMGADDIDRVAISAERDALEADFRERIALALNGDARYQQRVVAECWRDAAATELRWWSGIEAAAKYATRRGAD
jgi:secernin